MSRAAFLLVLLVAGCATPLQTSTGGTAYLDKDLIGAVEFDHGCSAQDMRIIRTGRGVVDLNVCGQVRRYRVVGTTHGTLPLWLDVTSLYPPSALPSAAP